MASIPDPAKTSLRQRLTHHARHHWPQLADIAVRYRSGSPESAPSCPTVNRSSCAGSAHDWGFAIYWASHNDYNPSYLPTGMMGGPAEDALNAFDITFDDRLSAGRK